jgi:EmrB/QacA subfamily drug resistance transporter
MAEKQPGEPAAPQEGLGGGTILALIAMGVSVLILAQDFSAMNVALPAIEREYNADITTIQWVINAYALVFAMLIVAGGRLADMFGRRRVFFVGTGIFAVTSALGGAAPSDGWLIAARSLQGIGGALMWPAILGMTYAALPSQKAGLAGALILGAAGIGQAVGPITGGVLTELWSWRGILFLNVPICVLAILITWREVHQPAELTAGERIDYAGIITLSLGLVALLFALDQGTEWGWTDPRIVSCLVAAVGLIAIFLGIERRMGPNALVPHDVMSNRQFTAACVSIALIAPTFFVALMYPAQFMMKFLGYTPIQAGVGLLPMMIVFALVSFVGGQLYDRFGAKLTVSAGAGCFVLGAFLLTLLTRDSGYPTLVPGLVLIGLGLGSFFPAVTTAAVTAVDPSRTSLAGGLVYMFQIAGGSVGLGLSTTVFVLSAQGAQAQEAAGLGLSLSAAQHLAMQGVLAGTGSAQDLLRQFDATVGGRLVDIARTAFVSGLRDAFRLDAALAAVAFLVAVAFIGKPERPPPRAGAST